MDNDGHLIVSWKEAGAFDHPDVVAAVGNALTPQAQRDAAAAARQLAAHQEATAAAQVRLRVAIAVSAILVVLVVVLALW